MAESLDAEFAGNPPVYQQAAQARQGTLSVDYPAAYVDELVTSGELAIHFIQQHLNVAADILAKLKNEIRH